MSPYLTQLLADLHAAILTRWQERPPHYFEMGFSAERWLDPPAGYTGPPMGFGLDDDGPAPGIFDLDDDDDAPPPESERLLAGLELEKTIAEMEQWRDETPPAQQDMYYHFGFRPEQFPPAERLTDAELEALTQALCRLWAAYNFTPVFPDGTPGRVVYPLLLGRMLKPSFVMTRGHIGVEFCHYEPAECPFGAAWCRCTDF